MRAMRFHLHLNTCRFSFIALYIAGSSVYLCRTQILYLTSVDTRPYGLLLDNLWGIRRNMVSVL